MVRGPRDLQGKPARAQNGFLQHCFPLEMGRKVTLCYSKDYGAESKLHTHRKR